MGFAALNLSCGLCRFRQEDGANAHPGYLLKRRRQLQRAAASLSKQSLKQDGYREDNRRYVDLYVDHDLKF